jgi:peptidoglycan/xylan/chitin deacetylase (PgdA/CDA1 family)
VRLSVANPVILIVGRLSGPKNTVILDILRRVAPQVVQKIPKARFTVLGGPVADEHRQLQEQRSYIRFEGHQQNLKPYYQKATVVIGAGRVALEAMGLKKPVIAIGERLYVGPLLPEKVEAAKSSNFGDCWDSESFDWDRMTKDLLGLLKDADKRARAAKTGHQLLESEYNWKTLFPRMESLYGRVLLEKNVSLFREIPVLMYHRVVGQEPAGSKYNLHILKNDMEQQLLFLQDRGFETIVFGDLLTKRIPAKPILLTFDDGYEDNYRNLLPLLKKYRMKAVLYLLGNRRHKNNFWDIPQGEPEATLLKEGQIKEMDQSGLVEFGAHSMNHVKLTTVGKAEIEREVAGSKKNLENFLQKTVFSFAYPYGSVNEEVKKMTVEAGYTFGVAVNNGPTCFGEDLMEIRRVHIFPKTSPYRYWKKTSGFYLRYRKLLGRSQ